MLPRPCDGRLGPRVVAATLTLLVASGAIVAVAEPPGEPIRLEYRAGVGCPDEAAFFARIRARTSSARVAGEGEPARTFSVELEGGPPARGSVTITDGDQVGTRRLDANSCNHVADGLALMVALALDPRALAPLTPVAVEADTRDAQARETPLDAPPPRDAEALDATSPPEEKPSVASPARAAPAPAKGATTASSLDLFARHFVAGGDFAIATGVAPDAILAGAPFLGWRASDAATVTAAFRLAFLRAGTGARTVDSGSANFTWTVARLDGCVTLRAASRLWLSPCARFEGGVLDVGGVGVSDPQTRHSPWIGAGPLARLEWRFWGPLAFDAALVSSFHLTADRFYILPDTTARQVSLVGWGGEAGLGLSL